MIAKDFFAEGTEVTEENYEARGERRKLMKPVKMHKKDFRRILCHFVHPALEEDEGWKGASRSGTTGEAI